MWELDHKEGWVPKNSCSWIVVLEKTLESPLDNKEIKPVKPKENQPWISIGQTDAKAEAPILWPPDAKSWLTGEKKKPMLGKTEGRMKVMTEMVGWHRRLNKHELEQTPGDGEHREVWCAAVHRVAKWDTNEWLNNKAFQWSIYLVQLFTIYASFFSD